MICLFQKKPFPLISKQTMSYVLVYHNIHLYYNLPTFLRYYYKQNYVFSETTYFYFTVGLKLMIVLPL